MHFRRAAFVQDQLDTITTYLSDNPLRDGFDNNLKFREGGWLMKHNSAKWLAHAR